MYKAWSMNLMFLFRMHGLQAQMGQDSGSWPCAEKPGQGLLHEKPTFRNHLRAQALGFWL